ncbi:MAG TPA: deoxyhypusine synthase, partial [candidate division Zixibacteria bacterium]|nr:deoxyhypusine synthase [candidate division Zixibacteria bacterium]
MKNPKVEAIEVKSSRKISGLMEAMAKTGFQGKSLARSVEVFERMI